MREKLKLLYYNTRINIGRVRVKMDPAMLMAVSLKAMLRVLSDRVYILPTEEEMRRQWMEQFIKRHGGVRQEEDVHEAEVVEEDPEPTVASLIGTSDNHNDT